VNGRLDRIGDGRTELLEGLTALSPSSTDPAWQTTMAAMGSVDFLQQERRGGAIRSRRTQVSSSDAAALNSR
jgi:hypothetical protein